MQKKKFLISGPSYILISRYFTIQVKIINMWQPVQRTIDCFPIIHESTSGYTPKSRLREPPLSSSPPLNYYDTCITLGDQGSHITSANADAVHKYNIHPININVDSSLGSDTTLIGRKAILKYVIIRGIVDLDIPVTEIPFFTNIAAPVRMTLFLDNNRPVLPLKTDYVTFYEPSITHDTPFDITPDAFFNKANRDRFIPLYDILFQLDEYNPSFTYEFIIDLQDYEAIYSFTPPGLHQGHPINGELTWVYHGTIEETTPYSVDHVWRSRVAYYSK